MQARILGGVVLAVLIATGVTVVASEGGEGFDVPGASTHNPRYTEECGSCHVAYPPALLPARSWEKLMTGLSDHFGEHAELAPADAKAIADYLTANAGDRRGGGARVARSVPDGQTPLRITELPYFKREHREVPVRMVTSNDKVRSFSNCDACHTRAAQDSFREREIRIPGHGSWED